MQQLDERDGGVPRAVSSVCRPAVERRTPFDRQARAILRDHPIEKPDFLARCLGVGADARDEDRMVARRGGERERYPDQPGRRSMEIHVMRDAVGHEAGDATERVRREHDLDLAGTSAKPDHRPRARNGERGMGQIVTEEFPQFTSPLADQGGIRLRSIA